MSVSNQIALNIHNETGSLKSLILGIANNFGGTPSINNCFDPQSRYHVNNNSFPIQNDIIREINSLYDVLKKYKVKIYNPTNINGLNQIFARDIGFVLQNKIIIPNIIEDRKDEILALNKIMNSLDENQIIHMPPGANVEGGDVTIHNGYVFIGVSSDDDFNKFQVARTNYEGFNFLKKKFENLNFIPLELFKSDDDPLENVLHLDCCFQPIGSNGAIVYPGGFKYKKDVNFLIDYFGKENVLLITSNEMKTMYSNIFSINEKVIISDKRFVRLNKWLTENNFIVEEIDYCEISKMGGLFRCSTMPLERI